VADLAAKLNEVLADERACLRALQRAESARDDPGRREVIQRVLENGNVNSAALGNIIRTLGGQPTDVASARFSLKLSQESPDEALDMAHSAQQHINAEIEALLDEPGLKSARAALAQVQQLHKEDTRRLHTAMGR
jgi:hypothetical protein